MGERPIKRFLKEKWGPVLDLAETDTSSPCDLEYDRSLGRLSAWMQSLGPYGFSLDFDLPEPPIPEVHQALTLCGYWRQLDSPDPVAG